MRIEGPRAAARRKQRRWRFVRGMGIAELVSPNVVTVPKE
jgi:hypothetical protein